MEPIKAFSNVIIGQFVLTRIPIKVYVDNRYLKITSTDDVQDPLIGFGMDEGINQKAIVSLILATALVLIQILWK